MSIPALARLILAAVLSLFMAACTSGAQQAAQAAQQIEATAQACYTSVKTNPAYAGVLQRFPVLNIERAPLALQLDNTFATPVEAQMLLSLHGDLEACRNVKAAGLESIDPMGGAAFRATSQPAAEIFAAIIQGRSTWGEGVTRMRRLDAEKKLEAQTRANADWQNRRALLMMEGPPRVVPLQSMTLPQPQQTNCTRFANMVNCTSY